MPSKKKYTCKYFNCNNSYYWNKGSGEQVVNKHFFRFPKNHDAALKWKLICKIDPSKDCKSFSVCEDHFSQNDFVNISKTKLKSNVMPIEYETTDSLIRIVFSDAFVTDHVDHNYCHVLSKDDNVENIDSNPPKVDDMVNDANKNTSGPSESSDNDTTFPEQQQKRDSLNNVGVAQQASTLQKIVMYRIHRAIVAQLYKLKKSLAFVKSEAKTLYDLYESKTFKAIEAKLDDLTNNFINSQLENVDKAYSGHCWTDNDKVFALSIYEQSPRLYMYLCAYFKLPSVCTLKI